MRRLDLLPTGGTHGTIRSLKDQMNRLFSTTISCTYSDDEVDAGRNMVIVDEYQIWWTAKDPRQMGLLESTITLSEKFFEELQKSPVIFYMEALKALRKSPLALDIYMWLTYRNSFPNRHPITISWESLQLQFGAGYPNDARGKADFKRKFKNSLKKISVVYADARKLKVEKTGLKYIPGDPHVPKLA
jgi:hypothetical protein